MSRVLVSFSCGAASAVAAKLCVEKFRGTRPVEVVYCDTSYDEHPDNMRFLADVEHWIGQPVIRLRNDKYQTIEQVWLGERYVVGPRGGASCTRLLKRKTFDAYARTADTIVIGLTADEQDRIDKWEDRSGGRECLWVLRDAGITKEDCYHTLTAAGIELPAMYRMGYDHNNCIGCCKGGMGYWNKVRRDYPDVFARRAEVFKQLGVRLRSGGKLYWLHELDPDAGRGVKEPAIQCGLMCDDYADLIQVAVSKMED